MLSRDHRRALYLVSFASFGWAVSFGLLASLAPLTLQSAGLPPTVIGLNTSLYYLGVAVAAPLVPMMMGRARTCVIVGMLLDAVTTAAFPHVSGAMAWHILRFLGGVGTAMSVIPMETLVSRNAPSDRRAADFGLYALCVASGIAAGAALGLPLHPLSAALPYSLAGLVTLAAMTLAWWGMPSRWAVEEAVASGAVRWYEERLSFGTAWVQGFLEGGTFAFLTLYLLGRGASESFAGLLVGAMFLGVVAAQLPVGYIADRCGRGRSLVACLAVLIAGQCLVPVTPLVVLLMVLFVLGAVCGALYPLGLALLGERVPTHALARANAYYLTANCAGSLCGPLAIGYAVEAWGLSMLFWFGALAVVFVLTSAWSTTRSRMDVPLTRRRAA